MHTSPQNVLNRAAGIHNQDEHYHHHYRYHHHHHHHYHHRRRHRNHHHHYHHHSHANPTYSSLAPRDLESSSYFPETFTPGRTAKEREAACEDAIDALAWINASVPPTVAKFLATVPSLSLRSSVHRVPTLMRDAEGNLAVFTSIPVRALLLISLLILLCVSLSPFRA